MAIYDGSLQPATFRPKARGIAVGLALLVGAGAYVGARGYDKPHVYVLHLEALGQEGALYFSAFDGDTLVSDHQPGDGQTLVYRRNFKWLDGCQWQATETLTPDGDSYHYEYDEQLKTCPADVEPDGVPTPMSGEVVVTRVDQVRALTPLVDDLDIVVE